MANIFKNLMTRLGFDKYYVQGGDWGSIIVQIMAGMFPDKIIGIHSNICFVNSALQFTKTFIGSYFPSLIGIPKEQEEYLYPMSKRFADLVLETGYLHLQSTKPDTIGRLRISKNLSLLNFSSMFFLINKTICDT